MLLNFWELNKKKKNNGGLSNIIRWPTPVQPTLNSLIKLSEIKESVSWAKFLLEFV